MEGKSIVWVAEAGDEVACTGGAQTPPRAAHPERHAEGHHHGGCCDGHHHHVTRGSSGRSSFFGAVIPVLACAVCPTCLGVWAQALSAVGAGVVITEAQHHVLLVVAIVFTVAIGVYRFVRTRLAGPFLLSLGGSAGLAASHLAGENHALSWLSIAVIVAASIWQHRAHARGRARDRVLPAA